MSNNSPNKGRFRKLKWRGGNSSNNNNDETEATALEVAPPQAPFVNNTDASLSSTSPRRSASAAAATAAQTATTEDWSNLRPNRALSGRMTVFTTAAAAATTDTARYPDFQAGALTANVPAGDVAVGVAVVPQGPPPSRSNSRPLTATRVPTATVLPVSSLSSAPPVSHVQVAQPVTSSSVPPRAGRPNAARPQPLFGKPSNNSVSLEDDLPGNQLPPLDAGGQGPGTIYPRALKIPGTTTTTTATPVATTTTKATKSAGASARTGAASWRLGVGAATAVVIPPVAAASWSRSSPLYGTASKPTTSLVSDDDDDEHEHDGKPASNPLFGQASKSKSLESDDDDNDDMNIGAAKLPALRPGQTSWGNEPVALTSRPSTAMFGRPSQSTSVESDSEDEPTPPRPSAASASSAPAPLPGGRKEPPSLTRMAEPRAPSMPGAPPPPRATSSMTFNEPNEITEYEAAIAASQRDQPMQNSSRELKSEETEGAKENARQLRSWCRNDTVDVSGLEALLEVCRTDQKMIQGASEAAMLSEGVIDFGDLLTLNDIMLDAVALGEETINGFRKKPAATKTPPSEIEALVETRDVFSLICLLRAPQSERRLGASLALMRFARDAEQVGGEEDRRLRGEICSSGGIQSLLMLFRTGGTSYELKVVASLALAYALPSFVQTSQHTPIPLGLKIMECLRFLSSARAVTPQGETVTREEAFKASAMALTTFWDPTSLDGSESSQNSINRRSSGSLFDQPHEALELQEIVEMTVSLIIHIARFSDSDEIHLEKGDPVFTWRYTLVEQVCAVEVARPIAVREGILRILVRWIKPDDKEKLRPAVSALRYLTTIKDKYMAGWIHSQMVNEGALASILALTDDYSVSQDVKLSIAQILSSLCVAPHTRAAVAEANCINYLSGFLYEHNSSRDVALFAGSALTQLAAGAITRASVFGGSDPEMLAFVPPDKRDTIVDSIVKCGAVRSFIAIALAHQGKLRSVAVGALRVLSEDTSPSRQTRLQLCEDDAVVALGITLREDVGTLSKVLKGGDEVTILSEDSRKDLHNALCALANILDPVQERSKSKVRQLRESSQVGDPATLLIKGCVQMAETGGLESLLWIASLPCSFPASASSRQNPKTCLLEEACRSLASVSPLLLSDAVSSKGLAGWADDVLVALQSVLRQVVAVRDKESIAADTVELHINVLRGLGALAKSEPLKVRIVDKILPYLVEAKSVRDRTGISSAASQAFQSLAFAEDEILQVAGNNSSLLVDWFCLKRSLLLQAMARSELQQCLLDTWNAPYLEARGGEASGLSRERSDNSRNTGSTAGLDLFDCFANDDDTAQGRESLLHQYGNIYEGRESRAPPLFARRQNGLETTSGENNDGLLSKQMYPMNSSRTESDWILSHRRSLADAKSDSQLRSQSLPPHVEKFLRLCFPSRLLRDHVVPIHSLNPESTFNFRALMMPQRRYFSFRREGQLLSRLCEKEAVHTFQGDVHWTLAFTNSTFSGEFVESLVQALYLIPMIKGLSFSKNSELESVCDSEKDDEGNEGGALLANLVASLPPWISFLTFDSLLGDRNLQTLVAILETVGKLSSGHDVQNSLTLPASDTKDHRRSALDQQTQGKFSFFAIRGSQHVSAETWHSFLRLLGSTASSPTLGLANTPLSSLKALDLSGNGLGDGICASILELVHDMDSGCCIEELDLSGNRILTGTNSIKVLRGYVEYYRYDQTAGMKAFHRSWRSPLQILNLAANGLHLTNAWLEIVSLLKHNALELKVLNLSDNGLVLKAGDYEYCDLLSSTLLKNTFLCQLNLSNNKFSSAAIDRVIGDLAGTESGSGLAFLRFENNSPALTDQQALDLFRFTQRAKKVAVQRVLNESFNTDTDMTLPSIIDQTTGALSSPHAPKGNNTITVLFSAPLVYQDQNESLFPFAKLDFDMERELMWQCLREASRDIELSFDNATHDRLLATIAKRCSCLHYSGHGHKKYLPFEDGSGGPNWFRVQDIKNLIASEGGAPFKFVFVSACHSGLAGETFASAGVPHVVCCQQESELKDTAALAFTRQFYLALAVGHTVKESFDQGCKAVRATPNLRDAEKEMEKFVLLPRDGNHQVPIFNAKPVMEWPRTVVENNASQQRRSSRNRGNVPRSRNAYLGGARGSELSVRNMMQEDPSPSPPQFFLGREIDTYHVLKAVLEKRLVSVIGESGVGRSSLVCALCHYINERASTILSIKHIYFVKAKQGRPQDRCRALVDQLMHKLVEAEKAMPLDPDTDLEAVFDAVCKSLKYEKALIVFDHVELLEDSDDANDFPMLLGNLFRETKFVKVLLTGRQPLGIPSLGGHVEHTFVLGPLDFGNTVRLFANLCSLLHTPTDRRKFFESLVLDGAEAELCYTDHRLSASTKKIFGLLGDGIPSKMEQAAYDTQKDVFLSLTDGSLRLE